MSPPTATVINPTSQRPQFAFNAHCTPNGQDAPVDDAYAPANELNVQMAVRSGRMIAGALFVCAALVPTMVLLKSGPTMFTIKHVEDSDRQELTDKYNSRSGTVAAVLEFPIEAVAAMLLSVNLLTFGKRYVLVSSQTAKSRLIIMLVSFGLAQVLVSGLSSLNVKLKDMKPEVTMNATDLVGRIVEFEKDSPVSGYENMSREGDRSNLITNTVLYSAVRPFKIRPPPLCDNKPQEEAIDQQFDTNTSFKIYMNTTKQQELAGKQPKTLPMDFALAENLFVNSLMFTYSWVKWWSIGIDYPTKMEQKFTKKFGERTLGEIERSPQKMTATEAFDLKPPPGADPIEHFVQRARAMVNESLIPHPTASFIASSIEFKSMNLSDQVTMDSITYELPMWKGYLSRRLRPNGTRLVSQGLEHTAVQGLEHTAVANITERTDEWEAEQEARTVYYEINMRDDCGPNVPACLIESDEYAYDDKRNRIKMIPEHRIRAIGVCENADGTEEVQFQETIGELPGGSGNKTVVRRMPSCERASKTSFYVSSFSYRIAGDAMKNGSAPDNDADENPTLTAQRAVLVNPRKIYTFTVARISWKTTDLTTKFNVRCDAKTGCDGLSYRVTDGDHLVVGKDYLPFSSLQPYDYAEPFYHVQYVNGVPLVATPIMLNVVDTKFMDYALGHNFDKVTWPENLTGKDCSFFAEKALITNVDNHYYMEGTLQPVYSAAFFFLFQDGNLLPQIYDYRLENDDRPLLQTLKLVTPVRAYIAIPPTNGMVTVCGSILLVLACFAVWYNDRRRPDMFQQSLPADTTVQVLMDDGTYPSMLLKKTVISSDQGRVIGEGKGVMIERVGLRSKQNLPPV